MRILSLSDFYPPSIGGMERHVQSLSRELVRRGHQVAVATSARKGSPREEEDEGVRVHRVAGCNRILEPLYESSDRPFPLTVPDPGLMMGLRRIIHREQPDIIHGQGWIIYSALPLKRASGAAMVVNLHDYGLVCPKRTFVHQDQTCSGPKYLKCVRCAGEPMGLVKSLGLTSGLRVSSPLHHEVDRFIAVSRSVAEASATRLGTRHSRIDVIPSLVPDSVVDVARRAARPSFVPPRGDYLMFVGGLGPNKGIDVLLAAHSQLAARLPLVVIATPPVSDSVVLPSDVTLVVGAEHDEVMGAWAHCLLGVVPSTWPEPFGQVAVEAMAAGKAVVASSVGGLRDIVVPGETGVLVRPGDPLALRDAIEELIYQTERREAMGASGRARAPRFFASTVAAQVEVVYQDVLAGRTSRPSRLSRSGS